MCIRDRPQDRPVEEHPGCCRRHEDQEVLDPLAGAGESDQSAGQRRCGRRRRHRWSVRSVYGFGRIAQGVLIREGWRRGRPKDGSTDPLQGRASGAGCGVRPDTAPGGNQPLLSRSAPQSLVSASVKRPYRVVVAKPGLDGHDRGAKVIARAFRDAGFEVIYTGLHQTAEQVVQTVVQEDADAVGLSLLSGAHLTLVPRVVEGLQKQGRDDVLVLVRGIIPEADIPVLKEMGVAEVFTPGAPLPAIGKWLGEALDERDDGESA